MSFLAESRLLSKHNFSKTTKAGNLIFGESMSKWHTECLSKAFFRLRISFSKYMPLNIKSRLLSVFSALFPSRTVCTPVRGEREFFRYSFFPVFFTNECVKTVFDVFWAICTPFWPFLSNIGS